MSPGERASELLTIVTPLEIDFDLAHRRIEELVGRSVWTHELANLQALADEIRRGETASFQDVLDKIPSDVEVIVVEHE